MNRLLPAILLVVLLASCQKDKNDQKLIINNDHTINVALDETQQNAPIPADFAGLSFETHILIQDPGFLNSNNKVITQLLKNIGPGMLRIGGGTSNNIGWQSDRRDAGTPQNTLTPTEVDRLADFSKTSGWSVLFGLNLAENKPDKAADEAAYAQHSIGSSLYAFQIGNEPDALPYNHFRDPGYSTQDFINEWEAHQTAIKKQTPNAEFVGPGVSNKYYWISYFADAEASRVKMMDGHYYETGPATDKTITYQSILNNYSSFSELFPALKQASSTNQLPFRITECNNVWGGGKKDVSDTYAASLWALDFMWNIVDNGGVGVNFHTGTGLYYSPVMNQGGMFKAMPEYYAMLAFKYGSNGRPIAVNLDKMVGCSAHACKTATGNAVTLVNRNTDRSYDVNIIAGKHINQARVARLSAPSVSAKTGITFAGSIVDADGNFYPSKFETYTVNKNSFIITMPAGSAAVVTFD